MAQEQVQKSGGGDSEDEELAPQSSGGQEQLAKTAGEVNDLLDEIDDVLEENAEEFVRSYVQKGGQ